MASTTRTEVGIPRRTTVVVLVACFLAIISEGYDVGVVGAVLPAISEDREWSLTPVQLGGLGSYALVGMLVGALFIGTLSDVVGRKRMLLVSMAVFTLTQVGVALAPTPELFGLFRLLGGLGMGGVVPVAAALTMEYSPPSRRSANYGFMFSGYSLGIVVAAVVALVALPDLGWRWVVAIGAAPVVLLPVIAALVPESLEYLDARGRTRDAEALAARLGIVGRVPTAPVPAPGPGPAGGAGATPGRVHREPWWRVVGEMFTGRYLRSTVFFWLALFCGLLLVYGLNTWLPKIMVQAGYDLGSALTFLVVFSLASAIGGPLLGWAADRFGSRPVLVLFYAVGAVGTLLLMIPAKSLAVNLTLVAFAGVGSISTSLVLTAYVADYYPARVRTTATGWALSFGRIGAICGPLIGGWIVAAGLRFEWSFVLFAVVALAAAGMVALIPRRAPDDADGPPPGEAAEGELGGELAETEAAAEVPPR